MIIVNNAKIKGKNLKGMTTVFSKEYIERWEKNHGYFSNNRQTVYYGAVEEIIKNEW